ncbi:hypothetical protein GCM10027159_07260 [Lysobacter terrae]
MAYVQGQGVAVQRHGVARLDVGMGQLPRVDDVQLLAHADSFAAFPFGRIRFTRFHEASSPRAYVQDHQRLGH